MLNKIILIANLYSTVHLKFLGHIKVNGVDIFIKHHRQFPIHIISIHNYTCILYLLFGSNASWLSEYDPNCIVVIGSACPLASHKKA